MDGIVVALQGRLGGDPKTRFLQNGSEVLQFSRMRAVRVAERTPTGGQGWRRQDHLAIEWIHSYP